MYVTTAPPASAAGGGVRTWPDLVATIDAMPSMPRWHQIEHDVDVDVMVALGNQASPSPSEVADAWTRALATRHPAVALFLDEQPDGQRMRRYGALALHALFFTRDPRLQLDLLLDEWYQLSPDDTPYGVQRMRGEHIAPLLLQVNMKRVEMEASGMIDAFDRAVLDRFAYDLRAHAQRLAQRRFEMRPLPVPVSAPSPAPPTSNREYLESILALMRAPGVDAAATLTRARTMIDTLKQSLGLQ
jgi:hypothetical protein